jgi:hypothetical protein
MKNLKRIQRTGNHDLSFIPVECQAYVRVCNHYPNVTIYKYDPRSGDCYAYGVSDFLMTLPLNMFN